MKTESPGSDMLLAREATIGTKTMQSTDIKQAAHDMIGHIDHFTWTELAYQTALKAAMEQGLEEANNGQLISQDDIEKEYGIRQ